MGSRPAEVLWSEVQIPQPNYLHKLYLVMYNLTSDIIYMYICNITPSTLVDTSFKLISDFFHVIKVFCVVRTLSKLPPWSSVLRGGGGGATGLLNKGGGEQQVSCGISTGTDYVL